MKFYFILVLYGLCLYLSLSTLPISCQEETPSLYIYDISHAASEAKCEQIVHQVAQNAKETPINPGIFPFAKELCFIMMENIHAYIDSLRKEVKQQKIDESTAITLLQGQIQNQVDVFSRKISELQQDQRHVSQIQDQEGHNEENMELESSDFSIHEHEDHEEL